MIMCTQYDFAYTAYQLKEREVTLNVRTKSKWIHEIANNVLCLQRAIGGRGANDLDWTRRLEIEQCFESCQHGHEQSATGLLAEAFEGISYHF